MQIINLDIQLIAAKPKQFSLHQISVHTSALQLLLPLNYAPQPIQLNDIT